jgi:hypothetical protein
MNCGVTEQKFHYLYSLNRSAFYAARNIQIYQIQNTRISQIFIVTSKKSDNIRKKIIAAEPSSLENMLKITKTIPKDLGRKKLQSFVVLLITQQQRMNS